MCVECGRSARPRDQAFARTAVDPHPIADADGAGDTSVAELARIIPIRNASADPLWRRSLTDPRPALAKVRCPVLALVGEKDLQVPPKENLSEIEKALKAAGNDRATVKELPGLNHLRGICNWIHGTGDDG